MSSANGMVGTGLAYRYRLQPRAYFKVPVGMCKTSGATESLFWGVVKGGGGGVGGRPTGPHCNYSPVTFIVHNQKSNGGPPCCESGGGGGGKV